MAREQRVVTPDSRVWYVRRRWARRRPPWSRQTGRQTARFDAEAELAAEKPVVPPLDGLFSYPKNDLGEPGFDVVHDERYAASRMVEALVVGAIVVGLLIAATVRYVVPWVVPRVVAAAWPILGVAAGVGVPVVLDRLQRPWFVELQRQGLADAPRRVWRVQGWRRSSQLMNEIASAIREGRIASEHATILFPDRDPRPPHHQ
jgi:hypothetical protein